MKNWWYYHKWYVIVGVLLCCTIFHLTANAFGWFEKEPDLQIAYVGEASLTEDTVAAVERAFSSFAEDYNQDGEILVQVNQYATGSLEDASAEAAQYRQAAELRLTADINDHESYFFLLQDPEAFQKQFEILADSDGTCPDSPDTYTENMTMPWESSPLSEMDLGSYTMVLLGQKTTGNNQEFLSKLYLGRRCFYTESETDNSKECNVLWETLKGDNN